MSTTTDPFEFVKSLWGQMGVPGFPTAAPGAPPMPSFAPEDLERRVAELRQVRQWLEMNLGILNMQINALEMQAATLRGLQAAPGADFVARAAEAMREAAAGTKTGGNAAPKAGLAGAESSATDRAAAAAAAPWADPAGWVQSLQGEFVRNMQAMVPAAAMPAQGATPTGGAKPAKGSRRRARP